MSRSAFDDLLDLGGTTENSNQSADPFDLLGTSQTTNQNATNSGGALLDLGFDFQVWTYKMIHLCNETAYQTADKEW